MPPEIIDLDASAVAELRQRIAARQLSERDYEIFAAILATYRFLVNLLTSKRITIPRLKKLLFGASTETTAAVLGSLADDATLPAAGEPDRSDASNSSPSDAPPKRRKGHGRNGADDYPGAQRIVVPHESLQPGDYCLECQDGTLYELRPPATLIRLVGQAPVQAEWHCRYQSLFTAGVTTAAAVSARGVFLAGRRPDGERRGRQAAGASTASHARTLSGSLYKQRLDGSQILTIGK